MSAEAEAKKGWGAVEEEVEQTGEKTHKLIPASAAVAAVYPARPNE